MAEEPKPQSEWRVRYNDQDDEGPFKVGWVFAERSLRDRFRSLAARVGQKGGG